MRRDLRKAASAVAGVCLTSAMCLTASPAVAQRTMGFGFCAPPYPPRCVSDPATYGSQADTNKCQEEVNRYVNFVGPYRLCLTQETERAFARRTAR